MLEQDGIIYDLMQSQDLLATMELVATVFPGGEPLTKTLGITTEYYYPMAEIVCHKALAEGLSHVARDAKTGAVIGFRISEDLYAADTSYQKQYDEFVQFLPLNFLVKLLKEKYLQDKILSKGQILYQSMLGVAYGYEGRHIARRLIAANIAYAKILGFSKIVTDPTGIVTQRMTAGLGFKEVVSISYQDFEYQGAKIFADLKRDKKYAMMEMIL